MNEIKIAEKYVPLIRSGRKLTTIRAGKRDYKLGPAVLIAPDSGNTNIEITDISFEQYGLLDSGDAISDGFSSLEELREGLLQFYPDLKPSSFVTIVYFVLED